MFKKILAAVVAAGVVLSPAFVSAKTPTNLLPIYYSVELSDEPLQFEPVDIKIELPLIEEPAPQVLNSHDLQQIKCMAENLYHEARGEPLPGQIAVSHVVMNRVESGRFPSTPCGVVLQRNNRGCQFSWVCTGTKGITNRVIYDKLFDLCAKVYYQQLADNTHGALFYHANYVKPRWSSKMTRTKVIRTHLFYKG